MLNEQCSMNTGEFELFRHSLFACLYFGAAVAVAHGQTIAAKEEPSPGFYISMWHSQVIYVSQPLFNKSDLLILLLCPEMYKFYASVRRIRDMRPTPPLDPPVRPLHAFAVIPFEQPPNM